MTEKNTTVAELIARSNRLGSDPKNTNYAGGNTSAKGTETDPVTGQDVELLWVKGSGGDLGTLRVAGVALLVLDRVLALERVHAGGTHEDDIVGLYRHVALPVPSDREKTTATSAPIRQLSPVE